MSSTKEIATALITALPEQASWDEILKVLTAKIEVDQGNKAILSVQYTDNSDRQHRLKRKIYFQ